MIIHFRLLATLTIAGCCGTAVAEQPELGEPSATTRSSGTSDFHAWAPTPPMGWNSWDYFGTTLNEAQAKAQADSMAEHLKPFGWDVFTVDIQWYEPNSVGHVYREGAPLAMDSFSRLVPAPAKFPSAAGGEGFKALAEYVHGKGLKFGIHIMRGIPKQAVRQNTPLKGTEARAADIADTNSVCSWNPDMFGVDMSKPGAQEYYDSLFEMYASWGVDFVKVDDIARPYDQTQRAEIEAIRRAIDKTGRPMVLSLSPGDTPIAAGPHVREHANQWRISDDFWDRWEPLHGMFGRLERWNAFRRDGAWPDADMLPFGLVEFGRPTRFTPDEQRLCMTLWCIARSPLIFGGDMTRLDRATLDLLTNPEVLAVNQASANNRQLSNRDDLVMWVADVPNSSDRYVALFNAKPRPAPYDLAQASYRSPVLRGNGDTTSVDVRVPLAGSKKLVLAVTNAGDGLEFDHVGWIDPTLSGPAGTVKLTDLRWVSATSGWGEIRVDRTVEGRRLRLNGAPVSGIGAHSESLIVFDVPAGYDTFTCRGALLPDGDGRGSVELLVLTDEAEVVSPDSAELTVSLTDLGINNPANVRDLWRNADIGTSTGSLTAQIPFHGAGLYRVSPVGAPQP